jgi:hypothetical protein
MTDEQRPPGSAGWQKETAPPPPEKRLTGLPPQRDGDKLAAWLREAADELDKAHALLDDLGVPRSTPGSDVECTLAARIALLADRQ